MDKGRSGAACSVVVIISHRPRQTSLSTDRQANITRPKPGITQHRRIPRDVGRRESSQHARSGIYDNACRGARATDIAILVVAADDGIMPKTVEAINHAKAAEIDIVVAINKMDKPGVDPERIKQELTKYELVPEEWGGDVMCVPISALTGQGIDDLLESVLLIADLKELKANPNRRAKGIVIESQLDRGRGRRHCTGASGTLHYGDIVIPAPQSAVRAMVNDKGETVKTAGHPSRLSCRSPRCRRRMSSTPSRACPRACGATQGVS